MKWKDTGVECKLFNYNNYNYWRVNGRTGDPFYEPSWWYEVFTRGFAYPKMDLSNVQNNQVTKLNAESTLFFDPGSGFPRFKLGLTDNKRCIKIGKADYIVTSGAVGYKTTDSEYVVLEDNDPDQNFYFVKYEDWKIYFNDSFSNFIHNLQGFHDFTQDVKIIYKGKIQSFEKDSVYLAKYATGEYNIPYITDSDLDKICCNMCPDPTYDEFLSIVDMLNSDDASVVQLGIKMLAGYNIEKYKLSFRLILCTRKNWFNWSRNLVACKQLLDTLNISSYDVYDNFVSGCYRCQRSDETYTLEDIAIAKNLAAKFIKEDLQRYVNNYYVDRNYIWMPDERTVELK